MTPFPLESWPPKLNPSQLAHLTTLATTYALAHSLQYLPPHSPSSPPPSAPAAAIHAPISLFPAPIPRSVFEDAQKIQSAYSTLYARVAMDREFLDAVMGALVDVDPFTGALWRAWKEVRDECIQPLQLGLFRSDYLLHQPTAEDPVQYKQVEFNTISSSFGALSQQVAGLHRHLLASTGYFDASALLKSESLPSNNTVAGLVSGMASAHEAYGVHNAYVLFVVQPDERNIFDQRLLEYELLEKHGIRVIRQTLAQLSTSASLSPTRALLITSPTLSPTPIEISLVYFRAGYTPTDYASSSTYAIRGLFERSKAIQCPSLALQLAGGKKVQEVLAHPGVLDRFLSAGEGAEELRKTWVGMWGLDAPVSSIPPSVVQGVSINDTSDEPAGTKLARERAQDLVLKPQREGGGNNVYRSSIPPFLSSLPPTERSAWIAMELIRPPRAIGSHLMRSGDDRALRADVISELGIFSSALFGFTEKGREKEVKSETAGWLVRTKAEGVDEGGVAAGFSVLDSVLLVD